MPLTLTPGTRLGPYEILSTLGAGGMGEVYRARDTKLNRDVAIKVLLPAVSNDPDRLARFSREAQVLASLNHPNIAHIYGLDRQEARDGREGTSFLVMELVEGEELAQRIARGAIPLDEALPIAKQIADALEAAHEQGIIHRDLKPANIKVRPDGTVKVLDFGLAKAMAPAGSTVNAMNSPTLSMHATQAGIILGTAAYMSPEQAAGKAVDKRSDLWAFGVVLMEMLTGHQTFGGETTSHVLAAVLKDEPDWSALPTDTPAGIRRLLRRCLDKDRKRRLADAADARLDIEDALNAPVNGDTAAIPLGPAARSRTWYALRWSVAAAAMLVIAAISVGWWRAARPVSRPLMRFTELETSVSLDVHGNSLFAAPMDVDRLALTGPAIPVLEDVGGRATNGFASLDVSASGMVVYVGGASVSSELSLFLLDSSGKLQRLPAQPGQYYGRPRASPDGTRLAVVRTAEGSTANLWVYEWAQNRMTRLTFLKSGVGTAPGQGTWTPDGKHVVFAIDTHELSGPGIYWVRADGAGEPQRLLAGDNLRPSSWSPDGKRLLYTSFGADYAIWILPVDVADSERPAGAKPELFLSSKVPLLIPAFSPDGRWVAYASQDSAVADVFVRPVRGAGKWQVSTAGGSYPMWSAEAHELFYLRQGKVFVASYTASADSFAAAQPRVWSENAPNLRALGELMPDGKHVVAALPTSADTAAEPQLPHVTFLLNFVDELRRRSAEGK